MKPGKEIEFYLKSLKFHARFVLFFSQSVGLYSFCSKWGELDGGMISVLTVGKQLSIRISCLYLPTAQYFY